MINKHQLEIFYQQSKDCIPIFIILFFLRSLIIRIYRPVGLLKTKFQCIIHAHREKYTTNLFTFDVNIFLFCFDKFFLFIYFRNRIIQKMIILKIKDDWLLIDQQNLLIQVNLYLFLHTEKTNNYFILISRNEKTWWRFNKSR